MTTVLIATNRFTDCRTILGLREHALLRVAADPLRVSLSTPPDLPSGRAMAVEDNVNVSQGDEARRALRIVAGARAVGVFWEESPLVLATLIDPETIHVRLDLRKLGINVYDDADGLHVGANVLARNMITNCETAVGLA